KLTLRQLAQAGRQGRVAPSGERLDEPFRDPRREQSIAGRYRSDGGNQGLRWSVLQEESTCAGAQCFEHVLVVVEGRQHQHSLGGLGHPTHDRFRGLDAVAAGHLDIHEDYVRPEVPCESDALVAVSGLTDDLNVRLGVEDHAQPGPDKRLVIYDEQPDHAELPSNGSSTRTRKPAPGPGPASTRPPNIAARSRMPIRPWPPPAAGTEPRPLSETSSSSPSAR